MSSADSTKYALKTVLAAAEDCGTFGCSDLFSISRLHLSRQFPTGTLSVWSEMAPSASRSYWFRWDLGICHFNLTFIQLNDLFLLEPSKVGLGAEMKHNHVQNQSFLNRSLVRFLCLCYLLSLSWKEGWIFKLLEQFIPSAFHLIAWHVLQTPSFFLPALSLTSFTLPLFFFGTLSVDLGSSVCWEDTTLWVKPQADWESYPVCPTDYLWCGNCSEKGRKWSGNQISRGRNYQGKG